MPRDVRAVLDARAGRLERRKAFETRPEVVAGSAGIDLAPATGTMELAVTLGARVIERFEHAHLVQIAPAVLAVLIHAAQGHASARQDVESRHVLATVARDRQAAVDVALVVEEAHDEGADLLLLAVPHEVVLLFQRRVTETRH